MIHSWSRQDGGHHDIAALFIHQSAATCDRSVSERQKWLQLEWDKLVIRCQWHILFLKWTIVYKNMSIGESLIFPFCVMNNLLLVPFSGFDKYSSCWCLNGAALWCSVSCEGYWWAVGLRMLKSHSNQASSWLLGQDDQRRAHSLSSAGCGFACPAHGCSKWPPSSALQGDGAQCDAF